MKNLLLLGMDANTVWRLGSIGWPGITMLFIVWKSWTNNHLQLLGFLTSKIGILQGPVQGVISPCALFYDRSVIFYDIL